MSPNLTGSASPLAPGKDLQIKHSTNPSPQIKESVCGAEREMQLHNVL